METTAQRHLAILAFSEDGWHIKRAPNFISDEDAADGWPDDHFNVVVLEQRSDLGADFFCHAREFEQLGALDVVAAVQPGAEFEMPSLISAGFCQDLHQFFICHSHNSFLQIFFV